ISARASGSAPHIPAVRVRYDCTYTGKKNICGYVCQRHDRAAGGAKAVRAGGQRNRAAVQRNRRKADTAAERKGRLRAALMV
ncbi:MAG: hypothetical protein Q4B19_04300, partial [Clostridia bacterium]|nr:hypothetical protein [Clostridia bacterium]